VKPDVPLALQKLSLTLLTEIGPAIGADYLQRSAAVAALMLQMAAEEWERGAARRAEENAALREIFRGAAAGVGDAALGARLEAAAAGADADLRISALDRANRELRALLVELHAHVERQDSAEARRVEAAIWSELRRSTERRALPLAPF
jgi:hypothetical protein